MRACSALWTCGPGQPHSTPRCSPMHLLSSLLPYPISNSISFSCLYFHSFSLPSPSTSIASPHLPPPTFSLPVDLLSLPPIFSVSLRLSASDSLSDSLVHPRDRRFPELMLLLPFSALNTPFHILNRVPGECRCATHTWGPAQGPRVRIPRRVAIPGRSPSCYRQRSSGMEREGTRPGACRRRSQGHDWQLLPRCTSPHSTLPRPRHAQRQGNAPHTGQTRETTLTSSTRGLRCQAQTMSPGPGPLRPILCPAG